MTTDLAHFTHSQLTYARSLDVARWAAALYETNGAPLTAAKVFQARWPRSTSLELITKAAVAAGTTSDTSWAGALVAARPLQDAFVSLLGPATLLGRIPQLRHVPFDVLVTAQTVAGTYQWVGEAAPKPVTRGSFARVVIGIAKAAGIIVVTKELLTLAAPGSEAALRDDMIQGIAQFLDTQFVDETVGATPANPASITNGITPIPPSGVVGTALVTDVKNLIATFTAANPSVEAAVLLMTPAHAVALAIATNASTLTLRGGTIFGIPVVTSGSVGPRIIILDAQGILVADEGGVDIDVSHAATVQMDSNPDDPATTTTAMVSLWQHNLVGLRAERFINWKRARPSAVAFISPAAYV